MSNWRGLLLLTLVLAVMAALVLSCSSDKKSEQTSKHPDSELTGATIPTLEDKLEAKKQEYAAAMPKDVTDLLEKATEELRKEHIADRALKVGSSAPDFRLTNQHNQWVTLDEAVRRGPVVLTWIRGGWCPFCNLELTAYRDALPFIRDAGGSLVVISPTLPDSTAATASLYGNRLVMLSDVGNMVAREYGLVFTLPEEIFKVYRQGIDWTAYYGDEAGELPIPATFVIDTDKKIRYAFVDPDYRTRAEPAEVIRVLKQIRGDEEVLP